MFIELLGRAKPAALDTHIKECCLWGIGAGTLHSGGLFHVRFADDYHWGLEKKRVSLEGKNIFSS